MDSHGYDLVCTKYCYIDESASLLDIAVSSVTDTVLRDNLPYGSFIHHPTVMLKKSVFDAVGGYRNFPCA